MKDLSLLLLQIDIWTNPNDIWYLLNQRNFFYVLSVEGFKVQEMNFFYLWPIEKSWLKTNFLKHTLDNVFHIFYKWYMIYALNCTQSGIIKMNWCFKKSWRFENFYYNCSKILCGLSIVVYTVSCLNSYIIYNIPVIYIVILQVINFI